MKLPGFLTPLGLLLGGLTLALMVGLMVFGGQRLFSPGQLSAVNRSGQTLETDVYTDVDSHADLTGECAACHVAPWNSASMSDRCAACHTEVQKQLTDSNTLHGSIDAANCRDCHIEHQGSKGNITRVADLVLEHDRFGFSLEAHQFNVEGEPFACADCHSDGLSRFAADRCAACHTDQDAQFMALHTVNYGAECRDCHNGSKEWSSEVFDHNLLAFPLLGEHAAVACADCHAGARTAADFETAPTECVDCHLKDNIHAPNVGTDCARCHSSDGWETQIFDHDLASFRLTGAHEEVACADCHAGGVFNGTPTDCVACHLDDDAHSLMLGTECADCHTTENWQEATFDHSTTGFELTGAHQQVACADCHIDDIYASLPQTCVSCHRKDDVHLTLFGEDCAACHITDAWKPALFHTFPLDHGGGGIIACATCHEDKTNYQAYTCYNCHQPDVIIRQHPFAQMMGTDITDCVRCHPTGQSTMQMH